MLPTMAGAADRCLIPEYNFDINRITELLVEDNLDDSDYPSIVDIADKDAHGIRKVTSDGILLKSSRNPVPAL